MPVPPIHIHIHEGPNAEALESLEGKVDQLMAAIDDLQTKFDALDTDVRAFLATHQGVVDALEAEIETLLADDSVEDSKLEGLQARVDDLRSAVNTLGA